MTTNKIFASLLVLAIVLSIGQTLTIKGKDNHYAAKHMLREFSNQVQHNLYELLHLSEAPKIDDAFFNDFFGFALGEPEILEGVMGGHLSESAVAKIKNFFKTHDGFKKSLLHIFNDSHTPECLRNLNDSQKTRIIEIIIDNMDFAKVLGGGADATKPSDDEVNRVLDQIKGDSQLGDSTASCFHDNAGALPQF